MASRVQQKDSGQLVEATQTSRSVTLDSAPAEGNTLVVFFLNSHGSEPNQVASIGAGWILAGRTARSNHQEYMWYKVAGAGESATITVSTVDGVGAPSATMKVLWVAEYEGLDGLEGWAGNADASLKLYTGATPDPAYEGGLKLLSFGRIDTVILIGNDFHETVLVGSDPVSHTAGSSVASFRTYEEFSNDDQPADGDIRGQSTAHQGVAMSAIFKVAGASAVRPHVSGSVADILFKGGAGGSYNSTTKQITINYTSTVDRLLVVGIVFVADGALEATVIPPAGWKQAGGYMDYDHDPDPLGSKSQDSRVSIWYHKEDAITSSHVFDVVGAPAQAGPKLVEYEGADDSVSLAPVGHGHANNTRSSSIFVPPFSRRTTRRSGPASGHGLALAFFYAGFGSHTVANPSNGFTKLSVGGTAFDILARTYSDGGRVCASAEFSAVATGSADGYLNCLVCFGPAGGDHWGWAEQNQDSWQVVN